MRLVNLYIFLALTAILSVGFSSCHKDTGDTTPRLITSMTIDGNPCAISCVYDDQSRVTSITQCDTVESFTYFADSIVYVRTTSNGISYKYIYALNAKGIATGYKRIASDGSITNYTLTYDADGNRTGLIDITHANTFIRYTIEDKNAVYDSALSSLIGTGNYTISRIYYANTENTLSYENFGKTFLGSSSANFKKAESYNTSDGQFTAKYTYELDLQNSVTHRTIRINDSIVESRHYEY